MNVNRIGEREGSHDELSGCPGALTPPDILKRSVTYCTGPVTAPLSSRTSRLSSNPLAETP